MAWLQHICDVCKIIDGDETLKECFFCNGCNAWICRDDKSRWDRRMRAVLMLKSLNSTIKE